MVFRARDPAPPEWFRLPSNFNDFDAGACTNSLAAAAALLLSDLAAGVELVAILRKAAILRRSALALDGDFTYAARSKGSLDFGTGRKVGVGAGRVVVAPVVVVLAVVVAPVVVVLA